MDTPDDLLLIGYVSGAFGLQGQLRLKSVTDRPDHLAEEVRTVFLGPPPRGIPKRGSSPPPPPHPYQLLGVLQHKPGQLILQLCGVVTREQAESLRGCEVFIRECDAAPLAADEYYLHQLYNLRVETVEGEVIGKVDEVLQTGGNDVLIVKRANQPDALIPMIHDVVVQLDVAGGRVVIRLIDGLL